jgi:hypothetical protein
MRSPELLPGPTAARWDQIGKGLLIAAFAMVIIYAILSTFISFPQSLDLTVVGVFGCVIVIGMLVRFAGLLKFRSEAAVGYSTLQDINGLDLRNAVTGEIIRSSDTPKAEWSRVSWFRSVQRFDRYKYEDNKPTES